MTTPWPDDSGSSLGPQIGAQLTGLERRIGEANLPGNLDGLLAYHILAGRASAFIRDVDPMNSSWLEENSHRLEEASALAVLGYGLTHFTSSTTAAIAPQLHAGLRRLMRRNAFPGDRLSFLHDARLLIGIGLAATYAKDQVPEFELWLKEILESPQRRPADRLQDLVQLHSLARLTGQPARVGDLTTMTDPSQLALVHWMTASGTGRLADPDVDVRILEQRIMTSLLNSDAAELPVPRAALLYRATNDVLHASIDQLVLNRSHVGLVLRRFEASLRRWRWDTDEVQHPVRWEIRSEREVQDILWIMLRSIFDDVVDEETLPKVGHSSYRADFGLPRLGILIEAKYAYKASDFKKIETEIMVDATAYLTEAGRYKEIVVFIYDDSSSVEHHDLTYQALTRVPGVADVVIASRPGVLPGPRSAPPSRSRSRTRTVQQ